jgi:hypothetical protein
MMTLVISLLVVGWIAAAALGTQAYFLGEQTKPIHERNLRSDSFEKLSKAIVNKDIDHSQRTPAYGIDSYFSQNISNG